jgi:signal transduction histidine kinase
MKLRRSDMEHSVFLAGMCVFCLGTINDFFYYNNYFELVGYFRFHDMSSISMLILTYCQAAGIFIATVREITGQLEQSNILLENTVKERTKDLEKQTAIAVQASRAKSEFLNNISHEIKTPLTVISVHVQQAKELLDASLSAAAGLNQNLSGENLETISNSLITAQKEIMRTSQMTENALRLTSLQESAQDIKPLDITELLKTCGDAYQLMLKNSGNLLVMDIKESLPLVHGNADLLIQVVANLLTNANTYTKDGEIDITASEAGEFIEVTIADNGTGIEPRLLPNVFSRTISGAGSSGIGLAICKEIITYHNGTIEIESELGKGTVVIFRLPKYADFLKNTL